MLVASTGIRGGATDAFGILHKPGRGDINQLPFVDGGQTALIFQTQFLHINGIKTRPQVCGGAAARFPAARVRHCISWEHSLASRRGST